MKKVIVSGIQPTGIITLGNYLGVIQQWNDCQINSYDCYFTIADLHSLINFNENSKANEIILDTLSIYLACGINYQKNTIFLQSHVIEHTQLNWYLNSFTKVGELSNMIQFKTKNKILNKKNILYYNNAALLNYPILMAADILLYNANYVPVGEDQKQHIEFTQKIAKRFNKKYNKNIFNIPLPIFSKYCNKIMSLTHPKKKMSKSDTNKHSFISLLDSLLILKSKIMSSITDTEKPPKIYCDLINKPGITNLLKILSGITNIDITKLERIFYNYMYKDFKLVLIENLFFVLHNIQKRYFFYRKKINFLTNILYEGAYTAQKKAIITMHKIKIILGLLNINFNI